MIRIGQISKIDKDNGMASVVYEDQDDLTTELLPILQPLIKSNKFNKPSVGDFVVVAHTENNPSRGVILGKYWNEANQPEE